MEPHGVEHRERVRVVRGTGGGGTGAAATTRDVAMLEDVSRPQGNAPSLSEVIGAMTRRRQVVEESPVADGVQRATCPGCGAEYGMPPGLTPPWGGRVRCPRCAAVFSVGVRAEADELVAGVAALDPASWERACADRSLWTVWGEELMEAYGTLRARCDPQVAARAFRRALEDAAPGVPWLAPPTPPSPLEHGFAVAGETMFERRQGL